MDTPTLSYDELLASIQQLAPEDQTRLLEDLEDIAFARDYETRRATGDLTPDELDVLPFDETTRPAPSPLNALPIAGRYIAEQRSLCTSSPAQAARSRMSPTCGAWAMMLQR